MNRDKPRNKHERDFWAFHDANPQVYAMFDRFTRQAIERGRKRLSVSLVIERIRWETAVITEGEPYKINNNHRAYYARLWAQLNPQHSGLFTTRATRTAGEEIHTAH